MAFAPLFPYTRVYPIRVFTEHALTSDDNKEINMLAPFSNYPVQEAIERMMAEERAARANQPHDSLLARIIDALFGARRAPAYA